MKPLNLRHVALGLMRPLIVLASGVWLLVACGGGGGSDTAGGGAGAPGTASYVSGQITGFGSVIVGGVRFDDGDAELQDDDGHSVGHDDIGLGDTVEIESDRIDHASGKAHARSIRLTAPIRGPVEQVNVGQATLSVLGQVITVNAFTVFHPSLAGGLTSVAPGQVLQISVLPSNADGLIVAGRVGPPTNGANYRLRGLVSALDPVGKVFQIGSALIDYSSAQPAPEGLANGRNVRLTLATAPVNGRWVATQVRNLELRSHDTAEAEVEGLISSFTSASSFSVNGLPVDASQAVFEGGQDGLGLGVRVEVKGAIVSGVLVATRVEREDQHDRGEGRGEDFELHGSISALDTAAKSFILRGVTVDYATVSEWRRVAEADLANGLVLEVKGDLSDDGIVLVASRVSRED